VAVFVSCAFDVSAPAATVLGGIRFGEVRGGREKGDRTDGDRQEGRE
jgi:hypothetical protein